MAVALAMLILVGHGVPLLVIGTTSHGAVHWFWLLLAVVSSAVVSLWMVWKMYRSDRQQVRMATHFRHFMHDLKSPIATLMIGLEGIKCMREWDQQMADEYLGLSMLELERLDRMIHNGIQILRERQPNAGFQMQTFPMERLLRDAEHAIQLQLKQRQGKLSVELDPPDMQITGDPDHLTNALINLLDNAIKYSLDPPQIRVRVWREGNEALLCVEDRGVGIDALHHKKIFESGFRIPQQAFEVKGDGIGLHYVARIADRHGGAVVVDSAPERGSAFTIRLPLSGLQTDKSAQTKCCSSGFKVQ